MNDGLRILLVFFSFLLIFIIFRLIYKNKIQISFSIFWLFSAALILLVGLFPNFISIFTNLIGFETTSNLIIGIILGILLFNTLTLMVIITEQNKRVVQLTQELSILKAKVSNSAKEVREKND